MKEIVRGLWDIDEIGNTVHCYAWQWEKGVTLIDTGMPGNADRILGALAQLDCSPGDVQRIIVTHADADHMGSLKALKRATRATVACHTVEKGLMEYPQRRQPAKTLLGTLIRPLFALISRLPQFKTEGVVPDELLVDGQELPEGFVVIHTPGHTPGHISLLHPEKRLLIAGDALNNRGGTLGEPPAIFTPDPENARRSIRKLAQKYGKSFDIVVFGHGAPIREKAAERIEAFADRLSEGEE